MEIIPALDIHKGNCVRLMQGQSHKEIVYSRDPLAMAQRWEREGASRLHVVDLDAAFLGRPVNRKLIINIVQKLSIPVQVGGGIRTIRDIQYYLNHGVDRVIVGTKAVVDRKFLYVIPRSPIAVEDMLDSPIKSEDGIHVFVALDVKNGKVALKGWRKISSISAISMARELNKIGVAGIIYTDISRDCMLTGPNTGFMLRLLKETTLPVIISGGISQVSDIKKIKRLSRNRVSGVIIGQALYTGRIKLKDAISI